MTYGQGANKYTLKRIMQKNAGVGIAEKSLYLCSVLWRRLSVPLNDKMSAGRRDAEFGNGFVLTQCLRRRHTQTIIQTYNLISTHFDTIITT